MVTDEALPPWPCAQVSRAWAAQLAQPRQLPPCVQALEAKELELIGQKEAALASERRRKDQALSSARRRLEEEKVQRLQSYRQKAEAEQ